MKSRISTPPFVVVCIRDGGGPQSTHTDSTLPCPHTRTAPVHTPTVREAAGGCCAGVGSRELTPVSSPLCCRLTGCGGQGDRWHSHHAVVKCVSCSSSTALPPHTRDSPISWFLLPKSDQKNIEEPHVFASSSLLSSLDLGDTQRL